jgi:oligoribonuclease NrnB/cAMP/cGMP phosphodiesterase (DHH superfamily)
VACSHGEDPPDVKGKSVAICDFSFKNDVTKKMIDNADSLVILDHHKSAMIELHDIPDAIFNMEKSGAVITWEFFHPGKEPPKFINYIEDRDLWKWKLPYSREFAAAFDMVPFNFEDFDKFVDDSVFDDAVKRGSYILSYSKTVIKKIAEKAVHRKLAGHDALVVNASHWMSEVGNALSRHCDLAMIWFHDHEDKNIKVSVRAFHDNIDASEIAKQFGGGGHKSAAGFTWEKGIEELFDKPKRRRTTKKNDSSKSKTDS